MGSFGGHILPGAFFLLVGLWWLVNVILEYARTLKQPQHSPIHGPWKRIPSRHLRSLPIEPFIKVGAALAGTCAEMTMKVHWRLVDDNNEFQSPNRFAHASMYGFFAFSGVVELLDFYKLTHFSSELEYVMLAAAFGVEGMLFGFHLHGRNMFDVRVHIIVVIVAFLTAWVLLLEACLPKFRRELFMARTVFCLTQATWFWQIAFTIYGPNRWVSDDASADIGQKDLVKDTGVITIVFCWHVLGWCSVLLICCVATSCWYKLRRLSSVNRQSKDWNIKGAQLINERFCDSDEAIREQSALLREDLETTNINLT